MSIDVDALRHLGTRHRETFHANHTLYFEGAGAGPLYVVLRGLVGFSERDAATNTRHIVETARAGEFFGEVSCFGGIPRTSTAVVQEDNTVLLVLDTETAFALLAASPAFGSTVIRRLCDRVHVESARAAQLAKEIVAVQAEVKHLREEQVVLKKEIVQLKGEPAKPKVDFSAIAGSIAQAAASARTPAQQEPAAPTSRPLTPS